MKNEPTLADYWEIITKNKWKIFNITLAVVLLAIVYSLVFPVYESEALIALDKVGFKPVIGPAEAKNIIQSSVILKPVLEKFYERWNKPSLREFNRKYLEVDIIKEPIDPRYVQLIPYIRIKVKADRADKSKEMASAIIKEFFDYSREKFTNQKAIVNMTYQTKKESIEKALAKREFNIAQLKDNIESTQNRIGSDPEADLLQEIIDVYQAVLFEEEIESIDLQKELMENEVEYGENLAGIAEFEIVNEPEIPEKIFTPRFKLNVVVAFIIGLIFSFLFVFFQEAVKKK